MDIWTILGKKSTNNDGSIISKDLLETLLKAAGTNLEQILAKGDRVRQELVEVSKNTRDEAEEQAELAHETYDEAVKEAERELETELDEVDEKLARAAEASAHAASLKEALLSLGFTTPIVQPQPDTASTAQ